MKPTRIAGIPAVILACLLGAGCSVTQSDPFLEPFPSGPDRPASLEVRLAAAGLEGAEAVVLTVAEIRFRRAGKASYDVAVGPWAADLAGTSEHPVPLVRLDPAPGRFASVQLLLAAGEAVADGRTRPLDLQGLLLEAPGPLEVQESEGTVLTIRLDLGGPGAPLPPAVEAVEVSTGRPQA